jgi:ribosomal protein S18 acetylase RimI-like enzyme
MESNARPLTAHDFYQALSTLKAAFSADPVHRWCYERSRRPEACFDLVFRLLLAAAVAEGTSWATDDVRSVAIWYHPGRSLGTGDLLRYGLLKAPFVIGLPPLRRLFVAAAIGGRMKRRLMGERPFYYLSVLGTHPDCRGRGLARRVLAPVLGLADQEHRPCLLESSNRENDGFYEHHRFRVVGEHSYPEGGPTVSYMLRTPR